MKLFPFRKTASEFLQYMLGKMDSSYQKTIGFPTYDILNAVSMKLAELSNRIQLFYDKLDYNNLSGQELTRFVLQRKGVKRKPATQATVTLQVTGEGTLKAGSVFETNLGIQFATTEDVIMNGTILVPAKATIGGADGNVPAGSITNMPMTIKGVTSVTNPDAAAGGYDAESDAELRARYEHALQRPATSGNIYHYEQWASEVAGVGACKVHPTPDNVPNTVKVVIIDADGQPASPALVESVQNHIDPGAKGLGEGEAPIGAHCTIESAKSLVLNVKMQLLGRYEESVKPAIEQSIKEYLKSIAFKQGYVSYAMIANAIMDTPGIIDYQGLTVNDGTLNIAVPEDTVAVLGGVTYVE